MYADGLAVGEDRKGLLFKRSSDMAGGILNRARETGAVSTSQVSSHLGNCSHTQGM
jgi:hypothetical protein